jgi:hypothetical protein
MSDSAFADRPRIELLAWSQCPSHEDALAQLESALVELGLADVPVSVRWVDTDEEAQRLSFVGSPSVRVDGREVLQPESSDHPALACRVYRHRNGRFSPLPDPDELRENLAAILRLDPS